MSLYKKYTIILFLVYAVCIAAMWFFIISPALSTIDRQSLDTFDNMIDMSAGRYKEIFNNIELTSYSFLAFDELYSLLMQNNTGYFTADYTSQLAKFGMLVTHFLTEPDIYSIAFYDLKDQVVYQTKNSLFDSNMSYWFKRAQITGGKPVWSGIYTTHDIEEPQRSINVISLFRMINNPNTFKQVGTMRITLNEDILYNVIESLYIKGKKPEVYLCDGQGLVFSARDKNDIGTMLQFVKPDYIVKEIPEYGMYVAAHVDPALLYHSSLDITSYTIYIIIILLIFVLTLTIVTSRFIIRPIRTLASKMSEVELGNLDIQVEVRYRDEVGMLTAAFNRMAKSLKALMENMVNAKLKENEMKLESLRLQIHPHFLLNTLDNIRWAARKNGDSEAEYYIETLSKMMHKNLYTDSPVSTVAEELDAAFVYIRLQQKRFGSRLKYLAEVPGELYPYKTLAFVLQPLLENSIEHGFSNKLGDCTIYLVIEESKGDLVIDITDDGKGTDEKTVRSIIKGEVTIPRISALKNLHDRITLRFGAGYHGGVSFYSTPGEGTRVVVTMPADEGLYKETISFREGGLFREYPDCGR